MAILWICGSRFLPRDPIKHDHSSEITGSVGTIIIYHEWPDMLQYMDKNVKIYHISGNIILFRNGLANLSIYIILRNGLVNLSIYIILRNDLVNLSINIILQNGLVNLSIYIILRNGLVNLSINIILRNGLAKSPESSFQTIHRCLQLVQCQL
mgnify:FL=1